jgi:diaminopimelate epimerase
MIPSLQRQAERICCRDGSGIGADGLLVLIYTSQNTSPEELVVINKDGSLAANCGNGLRCAAGSMVNHAKSLGLALDDYQWMELRIGARTFTMSLLADDGPTKFVQVTLRGLMSGSKVPWAEAASEELSRVFAANELSFISLNFAEIGNPHAVIFVDAIDQDQFLRAGRLAQTIEALDGINLHFAAPMASTKFMQQEAKKILGNSPQESFQVRSWERGVGETAACGSGASAVGAIACFLGHADYGSWVALYPPGGGLYVKQDAADDDVALAGPAQLVFKGFLEF